MDFRILLLMIIVLCGFIGYLIYKVIDHEKRINTLLEILIVSKIIEIREGKENESDSL